MLTPSQRARLTPQRLTPAEIEANNRRQHWYSRPFWQGFFGVMREPYMFWPYLLALLVVVYLCIFGVGCRTIAFGKNKAGDGVTRHDPEIAQRGEPGQVAPAEMMRDSSQVPVENRESGTPLCIQYRTPELCTSIPVKP